MWKADRSGTKAFASLPRRYEGSVYVGLRNVGLLAEDEGWMAKAGLLQVPVHQKIDLVRWKGHREGLWWICAVWNEEKYIITELRENKYMPLHTKYTEVLASYIRQNKLYDFWAQIQIPLNKLWGIKLSSWPRKSREIRHNSP